MRLGFATGYAPPGTNPLELIELAWEGERLGYDSADIPLRRFGGLDDLKAAVVFLASGASDYVTGQVVVVDCGQSAW